MNYKVSNQPQTAISILAQIDRELQFMTTSVAIGVLIVLDRLSVERAKVVREGFEDWLFDFSREINHGEIPFELRSYLSHYGSSLESIVAWLNFINPDASEEDKAKPLSMFLEKPDEAFSRFTLGDFTRFFIQDMGMMYLRKAYTSIKNIVTAKSIAIEDLLNDQEFFKVVAGKSPLAFSPSVSLDYFQKHVAS